MEGIPIQAQCLRFFRRLGFLNLQPDPPSVTCLNQGIILENRSDLR